MSGTSWIHVSRTLVFITFTQAVACGCSAALRADYHVGPSPRVDLGSISGRVIVKGVGGESARLHAVKLGGTAEARAALRIEIEHAGERLSVRTRCGSVLRGCRGVRVHYRLEVPYAASVHCHAVSAAVQVSGVRGSLRLRTVSGSIDSEGSGRAPLRARSVSGRVDVRGATGELVLSTVSGRLNAELRRPPRRLRLESVSGTIRLLLARGVGVRLGLSTVSGRITCALPAKTTRWGGRKRLRVVVGDGGVPVRARTVSGSIRLSALD